MFFDMADNETVVLKPVGDVELWYAEPADRAWRLPLHVEWKRDDSDGALYGLIIPGTCFYHVQVLQMEAIIGAYSLEDRSDRWLVPRAHIEELLHKAPGIHAEFYYQWPEKGHPPIPSQHGQSVEVRNRTVRSKRFDSFTHFISATHNLPPDVVGVVLSAIAQSGTEWLVWHRQPIDLGFVRLMAFPFRANWKEIVLFKKKSADIIKALLSPRLIRSQRLTSMRFAATLCSPHNVALRGGAEYSRIDYSIEAMTTPGFDRNVESIEGDRIRQGNYAGQYSKAVEKIYDSIVDCLVLYAKKTQSAWAKLHQSSSGCGTSLFPTRAREFNDVPLSDLPVDIIPAGNDFSVFAEREGKGHLAALSAPPPPRLLALPSILPAADDVRTCGGNGDMVEPRPGGTAGLSVLDASQGIASGKPVLSCGSTETWCPPRMGTK